MSKFDIASGIISSMAIDKNKVPEKVIAIAIICPSLKQDKLEMHLPKMTTSKKKETIKAILIMTSICIFQIKMIIIWILKF